MRKDFARKGFTLAETLTVLVVIGVVAALTIPVLIKSWQDYHWKAAHKVYETRFIDAVSQMNTRLKLTGYSSTLAFVNELRNYMKITQVCDTRPSDCFAPTIDNKGSQVQTEGFDTVQKFGKAWGTKIVGFKLANGSSALLAYNPGCVIAPSLTGREVAECSVSMIYDTNGTSGPNIVFNDAHKDVYYFNISEAMPTGCDVAGYDFEQEIGACMWGFTGVMPWAQAKARCEQDGAHLPAGDPNDSSSETHKVQVWFENNYGWAMLWTGYEFGNGQVATLSTTSRCGGQFCTNPSSKNNWGPNAVCIKAPQ